VLLLVIEPKIKPGAVALDGVQQGQETAVMVKAAFILRLHEEFALAHEDARKIHGAIAVRGFTCSIDAGGRTVSFEAIDLQLIGRVLVPTRFGPQRLAMTGIALGLAAEKPVSAFGRWMTISSAMQISPFLFTAIPGFLRALRGSKPVTKLNETLPRRVGINSTGLKRRVVATVGLEPRFPR